MAVKGLIQFVAIAVGDFWRGFKASRIEQRFTQVDNRPSLSPAQQRGYCHV